MCKRFLCCSAAMLYWFYDCPLISECTQQKARVGYIICYLHKCDGTYNAVTSTTHTILVACVCIKHHCIASELASSVRHRQYICHIYSTSHFYSRSTCNVIASRLENRYTSRQNNHPDMFCDYYSTTDKYKNGRLFHLHAFFPSKTSLPTVSPYPHPPRIKTWLKTAIRYNYPWLFQQQPIIFTSQFLSLFGGHMFDLIIPSLITCMHDYPWPCIGIIILAIGGAWKKNN